MALQMASAENAERLEESFDVEAWRVPARRQAARVVKDWMMTAGSATVCFYRAGQLGGDEARRLARSTGARC